MGRAPATIREEFLAAAARFREEPEGPAGPALFVLACELAECRFGCDVLPLGLETGDLVDLEWDAFAEDLLAGRIIRPTGCWIWRLRGRIGRLRERPAARREVLMDDPIGAAAAPEADFDDRIDRFEVLRRVLNESSERDRMVFVLCAAWDEPPCEVARRTGLSIDNVHQIVSRVRRLLRELLRKERSR